MSTIEHSVARPNSSRPRIEMHDLFAKANILNFKPVTLVEIQLALGKKIDANLPSPLVDQLGLESLQWCKMSTPGKVMNDFFAAFPYRALTHEVRDALATVEVDSRMDGKRHATDLRIAGVAEDSNGVHRAVGITYSLRDLQARELNVSVTNKEYAPLTISDSGSVTIPTMRDYPYHTAGFITPAMRQYTANHARVLRAYDSGMNKGMAFGDHFAYFPPTNDEQLTIVQSDGLIGVRQTKEGHIWSLKVPSQLERLS